MTILSNAIQVTFPSTGEARTFVSLDDIRAWTVAEEEFWRPMHTEEMQRHDLWRACAQALSFCSGLSATLDQLDAIPDDNASKSSDAYQRLQPLLAQITQSQVVTRESRYAPTILQLCGRNPELALVAFISLLNERDYLFNRYGISFGKILPLALEAALLPDTTPWLNSMKAEWHSLAERHSANLQAQTAATKDAADFAKSAKAEAAARITAETEEWEGLKNVVTSEWTNLKRVYDEKLALLAPTQYWSGRASSHKRTMIGISLSLALLAIVSVGVFFAWGVPAIQDIPKNATAAASLVALLPLLVPGFAVIWAMRILSRLLSETISMMRDARERETMVKTFLALLRDKADGQPGVTQDDRILILHSLFRPSSITAVDDSPPVHWFDLLTKRLGQQGSGPTPR
jgi:hypothetical protein